MFQNRSMVCCVVLFSITWSANIAECAKSNREKFVIVRDGKPVATIVTANKPTHSAAFAAKELQYHVEKMTGTRLPIVNDRAKVEGLRILVGPSQATKELGLDESKLKSQEYLIQFRPNVLVLTGRDDPSLPPVDLPLHRNIQWTQGKFGGALEFNGVDNALEVSPSGFHDKEGTLEAWIHTPKKTQKITGVILRLDGVGYNILQRLAGTKKIQFANCGNKRKLNTITTVTSKPLSEGWHHVMVVYSARDGKMEMFVDGTSHGIATYKTARCGKSQLNIGGGIPLHLKHVGNPFLGKIDEVRLSTIRRTPDSSSLQGPSSPDGHTALLLHFDEGRGQPRDCISPAKRPVSMFPPDCFQEQATSYAVHDFLENFCGVRWFGPTELLMHCPQTKTLAITPKDVRKSPAFKLRCAPRSAKGRGLILWNYPTSGDILLHWARLRLGGEPFEINHSFYGFYPRFWKKNSNQPDVFVRHEPKWFSQVKTGRPPQMCYTNTGFIAQVVKEAREYFDIGKQHTGGSARGDYFALCPQDNGSYCPCPACQAEMNPDQRNNPQFSNGYASDYIFGFVNKVAREVAKTHPDKFISALAYYNYAHYPKRIKVLPNVSVMMCLHIRNWWAPSMEVSDMKVYRDWVDEGKGRRLFLWLYYCFPEMNARSGNFHCFPGYFAHTQAKLIKMFARDGIRGIRPEGSGWLVDSYVTHKLIDDPSLDVDDILNDLFSRLYGPAAEPMKKMYLRIEEIFSNTKNYPKEVQTENRTFHQNEEIAWKYLGTEKRMAELGLIMAQAEKLTRTDIQKKRVALFREGVWDYMVQGRRKYLVKKAQNPSRDKLKAQSLPKRNVPRVPNAAGDPAKVDWSKAVVLSPWYTLQGYTTKRKMEGRLTHDGTYLYLQLQENFGFLDPTKLVEAGNIWSGDDWEIFFAPARKKPYFQLGIAPSGKFKENIVGATKWDCGAKVVSDISAPDKWTVHVAISLAKLLPGGVKPGQPFYANFGRGSKAKGHLVWTPNFSGSFHVPERLGEFILE